ncbi:D-fructose 1,6-bisphosphatase [Thermosporothrix hazakensis]|uniref:D-fructose 1,6-bisphosphatase n=2 Tax=Thermosporothrix TaxID=768650 RepID=A0A326U1Q7_THEHA|nr:inositol monophosphatase [Thermosporothrix hazakensis]PZW24866.1 D-fructose 1,6-bisphosphatase [Thermosporothrix hazakensis]
MLELLEQLFRQVRSYSQSERFDRKRIYHRTAKHVTMQFDRDAEDIIIQGLQESGHGFEIITEERETLSTTSNPQYRIVVDPIDGSTNAERGITAAAVALAVLPIDAPILPSHVQWALVGDLFSGTVYLAGKGHGSFRNGQRNQVSSITSLKHSIIGLNLDSRDLHTLERLLLSSPRPLGVRRSGSTAIDCVYVASGTYDAYVDVGDVLTGESFLASAAIVLEAGGIVTDHKGQELKPVANLTDGYSIVVAGNKDLHQAILNKINPRP